MAMSPPSEARDNAVLAVSFSADGLLPFLPGEEDVGLPALPDGSTFGLFSSRSALKVASSKSSCEKACATRRGS